MEFSRCLTKQGSKPFSFCKRFYVKAIYSEQFHKSIWCKEEIRRSKYFQKRGLSLNNRPLESFLSTKYTTRKDYSSEHIFQTPNLALQ